MSQELFSGSWQDGKLTVVLVTENVVTYNFISSFVEIKGIFRLSDGYCLTDSVDKIVSDATKLVEDIYKVELVKIKDELVKENGIRVH